MLGSLIGPELALFWASGGSSFLSLLLSTSPRGKRSSERLEPDKWRFPSFLGFFGTSFSPFFPLLLCRFTVAERPAFLDNCWKFRVPLSVSGPPFTSIFSALIVSLKYNLPFPTFLFLFHLETENGAASWKGVLRFPRGLEIICSTFLPPEQIFFPLVHVPLSCLFLLGSSFYLGGRHRLFFVCSRLRTQSS